MSRLSGPLPGHVSPHAADVHEAPHAGSRPAARPVEYKGCLFSHGVHSAPPLFSGRGTALARAPARRRAGTRSGTTNEFPDDAWITESSFADQRQPDGMGGSFGGHGSSHDLRGSQDRVGVHANDVVTRSTESVAWIGEVAGAGADEGEAVAIAFARRCMDRLDHAGIPAFWRGVMLDRIAILDCFGGKPALSGGWRQVRSVLIRATQASGRNPSGLTPERGDMNGLLPLLVWNLTRRLTPRQVSSEVALLRALGGHPVSATHPREDPGVTRTL